MSPNPPVPPQPDDLAQVDTLLEHFSELEQQLQQVRDGLARSHRLATLGTIATIIAHEYNNILTPVVSYCQLALANPQDEALMHKAIEKSLHGAERAASISSSLLGFAREQVEEPCASLPEVVRETLSCLGREPRRDGIELKLELPELAVAMTPLNLQQVLLNLVLNARKVMRRRGGVLTIRARTLPDGQRVQIDVADTGPGVPPELLESLFEPFVTHDPAEAADPATAEPDADDHKGTGLGLCICRELITQAGGTITVDSTPGEGATFRMTLPLALAESGAEVGAKPHADAPTQHRAAG
ncbi:MAG: HAMP domain-containing sensor histidine kinase [Phycisphaeraceae bacterium]